LTETGRTISTELLATLSIGVKKYVLLRSVEEFVIAAMEVVTSEQAWSIQEIQAVEEYDYVVSKFSEDISRGLVKELYGSEK